MSKEIDQKTAWSLFSYMDGCLYWIDGNRKGNKAGYFDASKGRFYVSINNYQYKISRVVFLMFNGFMPKFVDHKDNNKANDREENLRECTRSQNNQNRRTPKNNTSGVKGVYFNKKVKKWHAGVRLNGKYHHVGFFENIDTASEQVAIARDRLHGEFANHG